MARPLMPKATALWLMRHTKLTRHQIGHFCELHPLEMDVLLAGNALQPSDPVASGQLTTQEIARCEDDPQAQLTLQDFGLPTRRTQRPYTPLSKRPDIPHAVLWVLKNHPQLSDAQICRLLPTTKTLVSSIRQGTYWNLRSLGAKDPILLGLCTEEALKQAIQSSASE